MMRKLTAASALLLLAAVLPARADWLVTRAGGRIETKGHWEVKGKLIVFTGTNGALGSLRIADVDLPASEAATTEAKAAKDKAVAVAQEPPKPKERKKSVRSLTDADFSHKAPADGTAKPEGAGKDAKDAKAKDKDGDKAKDNSESLVVVQSWSKENRSEGDGIDLYGVLQNSGKDLATDVVLKVTLVNETNETVGTAEGVLAATSIPASGSTSFRVPFAGVFAFFQARFEVAHKTLAMAAPEGDDAAAKKKTPPASGKP